MLTGYIALMITIILVGLSLYLLFKILPSISQNRYRPWKISLKRKDIMENLAIENNPPAKDDSYLHPFESGEVAKEYPAGNITVQYYVIVLLFVLFDIDMLLLLPWAFDFYSLGLFSFIETIIFIAMPLFAVYYAFRRGYMRWMR
ncbi:MULTISPECIES: NADH-quinone oxidoreductase subunit A [Acidiplasma]|jgi:NADH-quinone oxidoreductase subunit A|nr:MULTISPECIES: NADH-quinone oxidoreductase subunit A [Acidiplasma]WMT55644.1 MAG: NADH-quinone oxidoreductase subunit A [Acidiplasma sp.]